jgi:predicted transcriptional regulator
MKNRSRPNLMAIILENSNGGITKTKLLTRANLTSNELGHYLDFLIQKRLMIELVDEGKMHTAYRTTDKGMIFLSVYSTLRNIAVLQKEDYS